MALANKRRGTMALSYEELRALALQSAINYDNAYISTLTNGQVAGIPTTDTTYAQIRADTIKQAEAVNNYFTPQQNSTTSNMLPLEPPNAGVGLLGGNSVIIILAILIVIIILIYVKSK
jgi:hypothetical protein